MAAIAGNSEPNTAGTYTGLRPVNIQIDLGGIAELIELCFGHVMDEGARAAIREKRMLSRSGPVLRLMHGIDRLLGGLDQGMVWLENGRLVGNVSTAPVPAGYPRALGPGFIIANVAVHPEFRGRGIARALMAAAMDNLRRKHAKFGVLQVDVNNAVARSLYSSLGFREERTFIRWQRSTHMHPPPRLADMPFITQRQPADWNAEYELARLVRPDEWGGVGWLRPTHPDLFRPSIGRALGNILSGQGDQRWITRRDNGQGVAAVLHIQTGFGGPARLTLMAHPIYHKRHEAPLLNYGLRRLEHRAILMEHPADDEYVTDLLRIQGFDARATLVNMRYDFAP